MRLAFDTSVLVAAVLEQHPHHARARPWSRAVTGGEVEGQISWHAAAETWSVLTRLPGSLRLTPAAASLVVDRLLDNFQPVEVSSASYRSAIRRCSERGLRSGALFDAIHLAVAEEQEAVGLVTFNHVDFARLAGESSPQILVPPDPPVFEF